MPNYRDNYTAARALVDALLTDDRKAATKHKITDRTLRNYRAALDTDAELSALFHQMRHAALTASWTTELDRTLTAIIAEIGSRVPNLPKNVEGFDRAVDAARALGEIAVAREVLGATARENAAAANESAAQYAPRLGPN